MEGQEAQAPGQAREQGRQAAQEPVAVEVLAAQALERELSEAVLAPAVVLVSAKQWRVLGALMWVSGLVLVVLGR
ncbi:hypothetical protein [Arthrobacter sp. Br18]|uniref:hypothetical protein n=1 Tax=Arthrobacter sp. Br18 TaxID=1312954 RepID=UPI00047C18F8|nr:hypothetical protein [Arthrobacter sp. Br18]